MILPVNTWLHSLMLALPNGGGHRLSLQYDGLCVALVDVGITEWRTEILNIPVDRNDSCTR